MADWTLPILIAALIADWYLGEPDLLWKRLPHPVVLFGKAVAFADRKLNDEHAGNDVRYRMGALAISALILASVLVGLAMSALFSRMGLLGVFFEGFAVFALLAQKSLKDHVMAVAAGLRENGPAGGRAAIAHIVGRDPETLDRSGMARAAIESLAENFSDGVLAPAFWYAVFGLPGIFAYKMINTADSMIGYRNERYLHFGRAAAKIDDLANWLPARLSALAIALGAGLLRGAGAMQAAMNCAMADARLHRSPNSGWPEAAMAGGLGIALGGPRRYAHETVSQAHINSAGRMGLDAGDIESAVAVFDRACLMLLACVALVWVVF